MYTYYSVWNVQYNAEKGEDEMRKYAEYQTMEKAVNAAKYLSSLNAGSVAVYRVTEEEINFY